MSEKWFRDYAARIDAWDERRLANPPAQTDGYFHCPCCRLPTLGERGGYEICEVCRWEDDGQDDPDADLITGGPNGAYSLSRARDNFRAHFHMYDLGQEPLDLKSVSRRRDALMAHVRLTIDQGVPFDTASIWQPLKKEEKDGDA